MNSKNHIPAHSKTQGLGKKEDAPAGKMRARVSARLEGTVSARLPPSPG